MLTPKINQLIFSEVLPSGSMQLFFAISVFMVCTAISSLLFEAVSAMVTARVETKLSLSVEAVSYTHLDVYKRQEEYSVTD